MRTSTKLALTGMVVFGLVTSAAAQESSVGKVGSGLRAASAALELQPDTAEAVYRDARRALNRSEFREAARLFRQLRGDYPTIGTAG